MAHINDLPLEICQYIFLLLRKSDPAANRKIFGIISRTQRAWRWEGQKQVHETVLLNASDYEDFQAILARYTDEPGPGGIRADLSPFPRRVHIGPVSPYTESDYTTSETMSPRMCLFIQKSGPFITFLDLGCNLQFNGLAPFAQLISSFPALRTLHVHVFWGSRVQPGVWTSCAHTGNEGGHKCQLPDPPAKLTELTLRSSLEGVKYFHCLVEIVKWLAHVPAKVPPISVVHTDLYPISGAKTGFSEFFRAVGPTLREVAIDAEYTRRQAVNPKKLIDFSKNTELRRLTFGPAQFPNCDAVPLLTPRILSGLKTAVLEDVQFTFILYDIEGLKAQIRRFNLARLEDLLITFVNLKKLTFKGYLAYGPPSHASLHMRFQRRICTKFSRLVNIGVEVAVVIDVDPYPDTDTDTEDDDDEEHDDRDDGDYSPRDVDDEDDDDDDSEDEEEDYSDGDEDEDMEEESDDDLEDDDDS